MAPKSYPGEIAKTDDDPLYQTERWFPREAVRPGYHIPLPRGDYRVTLYFAEIHFQQAGRRVFDVVVEGEPVLRDHDQSALWFATAHQRSFPTTVDDGVLDVEFQHRTNNPKIAALEIEALERN